MPPSSPDPPDDAVREAARLVIETRQLWQQLDTLLDRVEDQRSLAREEWVSNDDGEIPDHVADILSPREVDVTLAAMLARLTTVAPEPESVTSEEIDSFGIEVAGYEAWAIEQVTVNLEAIAARATRSVRQQLAGRIQQLRRAHDRNGTDKPDRKDRH